ncbi:MAG: hypothetical protein ACKOZM_01815 [Flavobacteriales bacterium]
MSFLLLLSFHTCFSQSPAVESRISQIKELYKKAQEHLQSTQNCEEKAIVNKVPLQDFLEGSDANELLEFPQKARLCTLPNNLSVLTAEFSDWEWGDEISFFMENGKIFFVFDRQYGVAGQVEQRIYFDSNGKLIRVLSKSDVETGEMSENIRVNDPEEIQRIDNFIREQFQNAQKMLN